jgi:Flp pilus assembly protein TadD
MIPHSMLIKTALFLAAGFGVSQSAGAICKGPQTLEGKLQVHADVPTYTELGTWFGDHGNYDCAVETFRNALKLEPGSAQLYYLVGLSLYSAGRVEEAVEPLGRSIYLLPEVVKPHLILGAAYQQLGRRDEAKAQWQAALQIDPHSVETLDAVSKALIADGDYGSVIELLHSAPHNEDLILDLALAYGRSRMLDDAAKVLTAALKLHPSSIPLTSALVTVYVNQVHYAEAVHIAEKSARMHPGNLDAQRLYLRVLVLNGDQAPATPIAHKLLTAHPHDVDFLYLTGILENTSGNYEAARKHLEEAVTLDPNHYNARYNLGVALLGLKDPAGASAQLEKALALGGTEPEIHFKYATALSNLGEKDKAQEQLKIYQQEMQVIQHRALAASKSAQADKEFESGDAQKAVALYREAVDATPDDSQLSYKLALALDRAGNIPDERTALEQAIKTNPGFALAQNQLGYLASRSGDSASAEEHFRLAVRAAPGYTRAWISLAATLAMESRYPEAQEAITSALRLEPDNPEARQLRKDLNAAQAQP